MKFTYLGAPQLSPEWFAARIGKVTASRLEDWLATSKRDGSPLKARIDYERELQFERTFNTTFERFVSQAMQEGIDYEDFARKQYEKISGNKVDMVGCWYSKLFCASPDGLVNQARNPETGLLEVKWLKDTAFTETLATGPSDRYWKQMQGCMWASGTKWCDFIAGNLNAKKFVIIRVEADPKFHQEIEKSLKEDIVEFDFANTALYDMETPKITRPELLDDDGHSQIAEGF